MYRLSIFLLGPVMAELDGKRLSGFRSDKVRALLAYLSMESHRPWARTSLAGLLWPDNSEGAALSNLRNALSNLRRVLGGDQNALSFLQITKETIQFNLAGNCWIDIRTFQALVPKHGSLPTGEMEIGRLESALSLYRGEFMEGFSIDSAPFEEWMLSNREHLRRQLLQTLRSLVIAHENSGGFGAALDYTRRWIELEPWDEDACRHRMRILAADGQRNAAIIQYEELLSRLTRDLGVGPELKTTQLYEQICRDEPATLTSTSFGKSMSGIGIPVDPGPLPEFIAGTSTGDLEPKLFVSRQNELNQLDTWAGQAASGKGGIYFVTGEPGSGKTALLREFSHLALKKYADMLVIWGQCNTYAGQGDPFFPFLSITRMLAGDLESQLSGGVITLEHVRRIWRFLPETLDALMNFGPGLINSFLTGGGKMHLSRMHPGVDPGLLASLNSQLQQSSQRPNQPRPPQVALFEQFSQVITVLSRSHPLLIILDDLQWVDPGSLSLLFHLGHQLAGNRIIILGAYRSEEVSMGRNGTPHPLEGVVQELRALSGDIVIDLAKSDGANFVGALLDSEPNELRREFRRMLYQRTSGHPLFTIEMLRGMQLRGEIVKDGKGRWVEGPRLNWDQLPVRVEAVISRRVHHLTDECQLLLNVACVEGEQFTSDIIAHITGKEEGHVQALLSQEIGKRYRLVSAQGQYQVGDRRLSTYRFHHSLFQTYLYNNLDAVERVRLHGRIGNELEQVYGLDQSRLPEVALTLAQHFESGKMPVKAVKYYSLAGKNALRLSANQEALTHFYHALDLLKSLPASADRDRQELELQLSLGHPLTALKGWAPPEMALAYERAQELCQNIDDHAQLIPALWLLATYRLGRSEHVEVDRLVERLSRLAQKAGDPVLLSLASLQVSPFYQGKFNEARKKLEDAGSFRSLDQQRLLAQNYGMAPAVVGLAYLGECLWFLGFPEQAYVTSLAARELAEQIKHPLTSCYAIARGCWLYISNGDVKAVMDQSLRLFHVAKRYGFKNFEYGAVFFENWANTQLGRSPTKAVEKMQRMMDAYHATGTVLNRTAFLVLFAQACGQAGKSERGLNAVDESIRLAEKTGELWYQAEALRVKGELLVQHETNKTEAEDCLLTASRIANEQQAKMLELRAITGLCRLWRKQGKGKKGQLLLTQIYRAFTEGFETPDLMNARVLLT